jgi:hypothetical protein
MKAAIHERRGNMNRIVGAGQLFVLSPEGVR